MEPQTLTFDTLLDAESIPVLEPSTKVFDAKGISYSITVRRDCLEDGEAYYRAGTSLGRSALDSKNPWPVLKVAYPPGKGKPFEVSHQGYLGALATCAMFVIEPSWTMEQWAIAGKKFGPQFISAVSAWAIDQNGLRDEQPKDKVPDPKAMTSNQESSEPVSPSSESLPESP